MTAKDMFEALDWELGILNVYDRDDVLYYRKKEGSAEYDLIFFFEDKTYGVDGFTKGYGIRYNLNAQEHLAITQQMKELGWIDEPTLEHLFGNTQYDIDKLTLIDDETAYQLYGTEAQHFKNHMAKVAERDLKKYKTDEEDTQSETSLNHMFGNVFEQLDNLKLKKKGEK